MAWTDLFNFKKAATFESDANGSESELSENIALRDGALRKIAGYVGRTLSKAHFVVKGSLLEKDWEYLLNVRPNPNQTAAEFWQEVGFSLINDGEALLVVYKTNLYIAENFSKEKNLQGDIYKVTNIQGVTFDGVFQTDKVIYIKNSNEALSTYSASLWTDYGELLGRLINRQKTANQIRFTLAMPTTKLQDRAQESADGQKPDDPKKRFINRVTNLIKTSSVVAIPLQKDSGYQEYSNKYSSKASFVDDIKNVKNQYVDDLCELIGFPVGLIHSDTADNSNNYEQFLEAVMEPLVAPIIDALHFGIFTEDESKNGAIVRVTGLRKRDIFDVATPIDKLIASGFANVDELREEFGLKPLPNGLGQRYYLTKNYEELGEKGEKIDESTTD